MDLISGLLNMTGWDFRSQRWDVTMTTHVHKMEVKDSTVAMVCLRCIIYTRDHHFNTNKPDSGQKTFLSAIAQRFHQTSHFCWGLLASWQGLKSHRHSRTATQPTSTMQTVRFQHSDCFSVFYRRGFESPQSSHITLHCYQAVPWRSIRNISKFPILILTTTDC